MASTYYPALHVWGRSAGQFSALTSTIVSAESAVIAAEQVRAESVAVAKIARAQEDSILRATRNPSPPTEESVNE